MIWLLLKRSTQLLDTFKHNSRIGKHSFFSDATVSAPEIPLRNEQEAVILEDQLADESDSQGR